MFNIERFLQKFSKGVQSAEFQKEKIIEIIKKNTQIELTKNDLEIKEYVLMIKSSPAVKNKLFISKNKILEDCNNLTEMKLVDIR